MAENKYPLTAGDLQQMGTRMAAGEDMYIPCRADVTLTDGRVILNMLSWGSPRAYRVERGADGQWYSVYIHGK